jgi:hypothetical protein
MGATVASKWDLMPAEFAATAGAAADRARAVAQHNRPRLALLLRELAFKNCLLRWAERKARLLLSAARGCYSWWWFMVQQGFQKAYWKAKSILER